MKIRITGAKKDTYWYADKIGETFESTGKCGISGGLLVVHEGVRDRYVVQPGDYEVVSDESAPISGITVLPDESLGGIQREYREVKRKAGVGELAKIVGNYGGHCFPLGEVVRKTEEDRADYLDGHDFWFVEDDDCHALEPTDVIVIDGERLRMVDRKAAVGERVIIANPDSDAKDHGGYVPGDIATITCTGSDDYGTFYDARMTNGKGIAVYAKEYRVLEPVTTPVPLSTRLATLLSSRSYADQIAENIAALTAKVQALESRVAALEDERKLVKVASGPVDRTPPSFITLKTPQQIRDEIVERAKADVKALTAKIYDSWVGSDIPAHREHGPLTVSFVINRDKRKVTALLRYKHFPETVAEVGRAKCAPNDVFNAHIGRAISLRRAFGLVIPAEYLNAPNPTEVRVGDVVTYPPVKGRTEYEVVSLFDSPGNLRITKSVRNPQLVGVGAYASDGVGHTAIILDDTREGENPSSSQKGAAA